MRVWSIFHITKRKRTPKITFHISEEVSTTGKLNNPQCANLQKQKEKLSLAQQQSCKQHGLHAFPMVYKIMYNAKQTTNNHASVFIQ